MSETDDNESLRRQLKELEARVARLEAEREPLRESPSAADVAAELAAARERDAASGKGAAPWPVAAPPIPEAVPGAEPESSVQSEPAAQAKSRATQEKGDLEQFFALTVLGRVGIAAIVMAAAYFGQLGWKTLGPGSRAILTYLFGVIMIAGGAGLRRIVDQRFVALVWGGGIALTYVAGVLAHLRYEVMSSSAAMASLLVSAALGQWLARNLGLQIMATTALAGAYAAPVIVGTPSPAPTAFFVLLLGLHLWAAWIEHRWQWHQARVLAVAATLVLVVAWYVDSGIVSATSLFWHVEAVWLFLALPELLRGWLGRPVAAGRAWSLFFVGLVAQIAATSNQALAPSVPLVIGASLLVVGALYVPRCAVLGQFLARISAFLLPLGVIRWLYAATDEPWSRYPEWHLVVGLASVGLLQLVVRRWTLVGELGAGVAATLGCILIATAPDWDEALSLVQVPLLLVVPVTLLVVARPVGCQVYAFLIAIACSLVGVLDAHAPPAEGYELVALALVVASTVAAFGSWLSGHRQLLTLGRTATGVHALLLLGWLGYCVRQPIGDAAAPLTAFWNMRFLAVSVLVSLVALARQLLPQTELQQRAVLGAVILIATYCGGLLEVLELIHGWSFGQHAAATSIYTLLFATMLLVAGGLKRIVALRWTALVMFGGVAAKVGVYDLSDASTPMRVLVTGVLGAVLLLVAWGYSRQQRREP